MKTTPALPMVGDSVELVMRVENFGEKEINSIKVNIDHPFEGNKETFIGTLKCVILLLCFLLRSICV